MPDQKPRTEEQRHLNRSSMGVAIGVVVLLLIVGVDNLATLAATLVLGIIGGAYVGSLADIRGHACDALKWTIDKLDNKEPTDAE